MSKLKNWIRSWFTPIVIERSDCVKVLKAIEDIEKRTSRKPR